MTFLDSLAARFGYVKSKADFPAPLLAQAQGARYTIPDGSAHQTQITLYTQLDWISSAIEHVSNIAASSKFSIKKLEGEKETDIPNHPFETLANRPNPLQTGMELWRDYFSWRMLTGNAYLFLNRTSENAPVAEAWVLPSNMVKPVPDGKMYLRGYLFTPDAGPPIALETWQISHCKSFNPVNPFVGLSAVQSLAYVGIGDIAQQKYNANLFDKNNAKVPGALAFSDFIADEEWEKIKTETRENWGGSARSGPLFLRGVGGGGVAWVSMALTQKEMEFLESRRMTKEEIFGRLAPGLASMTDVNATEANATTGRATLIDLAVWPLLMTAAGRIQTDILPTYGENLICVPDDIRVTNRVLDLQERQEYSRTHYVNEIRSEYDGDEPLPDGNVPIEVWQRGQAQNKPSVTDTTEPIETHAADMLTDETQAEMKAWERFALKRLGKAGGRDFVPRALPVWEAARIRAALKMAATPEAVRAVFGGEMTDSVAALKASIDAARDELARESQAGGTHIHLPDTLKADFSAAIPQPVIHVAAPSVTVTTPDLTPALMSAAQSIVDGMRGLPQPSVTVPVTVQPAPVTVEQVITPAEDKSGRRNTDITFKTDRNGKIIGASAVTEGE